MENPLNKKKMIKDYFNAKKFESLFFVGASLFIGHCFRFDLAASFKHR